MNEIPARAAGGEQARPALMQGMDWPLLAVSGGFLLCFLAAALVDIDAVSALVGALFAWSTKVFGLYWQILMLATFVISLGIGFSRCGRVRLGGVDRRPDISTFNWIAVIMCAAGGRRRVLGRRRALDALRQSAAPVCPGAAEDRNGGARGAGAVLRALGLPGLGRAWQPAGHRADAPALRQGPAAGASHAAVSAAGRARAQGDDRQPGRRRLHHRGGRGHDRPDRLPGPADQQCAARRVACRTT